MKFPGKLMPILRPFIKSEYSNSVRFNERIATYPENFIFFDEVKYYTTPPYLPAFENLLNNLEWQEIVSIEPQGIKKTYDLEMVKHPFFIANGIVAHNSTLSAMALGQAQKKGMVTVLLDTEHSYDPLWARKHGVDPELLIVLEPKHIQAIFDSIRVLTETLSENKKDDFSMLAIVDSVSGTPTSEELAQEDSTAGKGRANHARALSEGLRKITNAVWENNIALVFISQLKDNPGILYGTGKHKLGGSAIDFHASLLLETHVVARKKQAEVPIIQVVKVNSTKNKFVPPFRRANFEIHYINGVDNRLTAIEFMMNLGWLKKAKGWVELEDGTKVRKTELIDTISDETFAKLYDYLGITNLDNKENGNNLTYNFDEKEVENTDE